VDLGIGHPQPAFWERSIEAIVAPAGNAPGGGIAQAEARFAADARALGMAAAYRRHGAANLRFYRQGLQPAVGLDAALASPAMKDEALAWAIERSETARSRDWGYARGSYAPAAEGARTAGWYMRVWRLEGDAWRIVLDVTNAAAPA
jgi:hypothetical protein